MTKKQGRLLKTMTKMKKKLNHCFDGPSLFVQRSCESDVSAHWDSGKLVKILARCDGATAGKDESSSC